MSRSQTKYFKTWNYHRSLNPIDRYVKEMTHAMSSCTKLEIWSFRNFSMTQKQFWRIFCAIPNSLQKINFGDWRIRWRNLQDLGTALQQSELYSISFFYFHITPCDDDWNCFEHQEKAENIIETLSKVESLRSNLSEFECWQQTHHDEVQRLLIDNGFLVTYSNDQTFT